MKEIRKGSLRHTAFRAYAYHAFERKLPMLDPQTAHDFTTKLGEELGAATESDTMVFGNRTESMFYEMMSSLGAVKFMKQEDSGDCMAEDEGLQIPDFRLILRTNEHLLVEVKNYHQTNPTNEFRIGKTYLDGLNAYASLMKCELLVAVYWSKWNLWSLIPVNAFERNGEHFTIPMTTAMIHNQMARVGDKNIGTRMPLSFVMEVTQEGDFQHGAEGEKEFTARIQKVSVTCGGTPVEDKIEQGIAMYLMLFGGLEDTVTTTMEGPRVSAIVHTLDKHEHTGQGFEIVGTLSSMFSRWYRAATSSDSAPKTITQVHARSTPGALGRLIPEGYKSASLPLWIMIQRPA